MWRLMSSIASVIKSYLAIGCVLFISLLAGCATSPNTEYGQKTEHEQTVTVSSPVKNVPVTVSYQGGVFYRVQVNNTLPTEISLMWDESSYVTTTGVSVRLLHLPNKNDLPQNPPAKQASTPIAPDSKFQADFTGDEWLDCARRNCKPQPKNISKNARIVLAFKIKGKRVRWQGEIAFAQARQP